MKNKKSLGFTLVELLTVIAIILVLLGLVFKVGSSAGKKVKIAQTVSRLEHLKMCIEEYYVKWGQYPPVTGGTACEWINANERFGPSCSYAGLVAAHEESGDTSFNVHPVTLPAFLMDNGTESQVMTYNEIGEYRDQTGWGSRWPGDPNPDDFVVTHGALWEDEHASVGQFVFSNRIYTITDSWGGLFQYQVGPNYQSYKVWSNGGGNSGAIGDDSFVN